MLQKKSGAEPLRYAMGRLSTEHSEVVDLHAIVAEALGILERSIDRKIHVVRQLSAPSAAVQGDSSRLQTCILNLALNARDAMPHGGTLRIASESVVLDADSCRRQALPVDPGPYVALEVADDGPGADDARVMEAQGLGLAAVRQRLETRWGTDARMEIVTAPHNGFLVRLRMPSIATPMLRARTGELRGPADVVAHRAESR